MSHHNLLPVIRLSIGLILLMIGIIGLIIPILQFAILILIALPIISPYHGKLFIAWVKKTFHDLTK